MQANSWKQRTQQLGKKPRSLHPYPIKQVFYSRPKQSIFRGHLRLKMLSAFIIQCVAAQQCLIRQLVNQRHRQLVPLVLEPPSPQTTNTSIR